MTKRQKTTKAQHYTARLNPIHELDAVVMKVIEYWKGEGVTFKQLIMDRISRIDLQVTPEIYTRETEMVNAQLIESLLERYTDNLLSELEKRGIQTATLKNADEGAGGSTPFSKRFSQGFLARQQQTKGDSGDDDQ
jgi:hypothetical protein